MTLTIEAHVTDLTKEALEPYKNHKRLRVFYLKGWECKICGITANKIVQHTDINGGNHIDLYHISEERTVLLTVDHILPRSRGGTGHLTNLQPLCCKCNGNKGDKINSGTTQRLKILPKTKKKICFEDEDRLFVLRYDGKPFYATNTKETSKFKFVYPDLIGAQQSIKNIARTYGLDQERISIAEYCLTKKEN